MSNNRDVVEGEELLAGANMLIRRRMCLAKLAILDVADLAALVSVIAVLRTWTQDTLVGEIVVVVSDDGIVAISWADQRPDDAVGAVPERDHHIAQRLDAWFRGDDRHLDVDVDLRGVDGFRREVLDTLRKEVAWGETVSYGELAEMAGRSGAARAVGTAMASNPVPFVIPCHRVVAAGGRIGGYGGTASTASANVAIKRKLLAREGVMFER